MERLTPNKLDGAFDPLYLGNLTQQINHITGKGKYAMIQPHNYGRFYGEIITDTTGFKTWWKNVAAQYKDNALVVFDTNNEFHGKYYPYPEELSTCETVTNSTY
jgi:endoglucanase